MTTSDQRARSAGLLRRRWPAIVFALAGMFLCLAIALSVYLRGRIVVLGSWDAYRLDVLLWIAAVWCVAASLMGTLTRGAQGRRGWSVIRDLVGVAILIAALPVTAVVAAVVSLTVGVDNQTKLDTPPGTAKYIVSAAERRSPRVIAFTPTRVAGPTSCIPRRLEGRRVCHLRVSERPDADQATRSMKSARKRSGLIVAGAGWVRHRWSARTQGST